MVSLLQALFTSLWLLFSWWNTRCGRWWPPRWMRCPSSDGVSSCFRSAALFSTCSSARSGPGLATSRTDTGILWITAARSSTAYAITATTPRLTLTFRQTQYKIIKRSGVYSNVHYQPFSINAHNTVFIPLILVLTIFTHPILCLFKIIHIVNTKIYWKYH